jgi:hypothetical protein
MTVEWPASWELPVPIGPPIARGTVCGARQGVLVRSQDPDPDLGYIVRVVITAPVQ